MLSIDLGSPISASETNIKRIIQSMLENHELFYLRPLYQSACTINQQLRDTFKREEIVHKKPHDSIQSNEFAMPVSAEQKDQSSNDISIIEEVQNSLVGKLLFGYFGGYVSNHQSMRRKEAKPNTTTPQLTSIDTEIDLSLIHI